MAVGLERRPGAGRIDLSVTTAIPIVLLLSCPVPRIRIDDADCPGIAAGTTIDSLPVSNSND